MRLKDKVAIVTGGAHGMGASEARLFTAGVSKRELQVVCHPGRLM
jgi:NAD(P)-dependent dehydrogenase (short-subunit alcohol dehydrogenase family)